MNAADTAWMLVSTALVLVVPPALGFFYGGLVRSKNALNTLMMSVSALGFVCLAWVVLGYSLAFSPGTPWLGGIGRAFLQGVGLEPQGTIPHLLFMAYQATFAIITAALVSGAIVERMRFSAYLAFITLWSLLVYSPIAHWVWGGGWLGGMGALDFAGGTVVHINAGVAALVAALILGPRQDYARQAILPHNVPFTLLVAGRPRPSGWPPGPSPPPPASWAPCPPFSSAGSPPCPAISRFSGGRARASTTRSTWWRPTAWGARWGRS